MASTGRNISGASCDDPIPVKFLPVREPDKEDKRMAELLKWLLDIARENKRKREGECAA